MNKGLSLQDTSFFNNSNIFFQLGDLHGSPPPINWLIKGFISEKTVGAVVATGSTGKSWFLLQLSFAIATGDSFMGMENPNDPSQVLYIMGEEEKNDIHRRVASIKEVYKEKKLLNNEDSANENLSFLCVNGERAYLREKSPLLESLKIYIQIKKPKLIILDPAIRFFDGDENNSSDATRFIEILEGLKNMDTTIIFAHHTGKMLSGELSQHSARGSSAFIDGARWNLVLTKILKKDANKYSYENSELDLLPEQCGFYINADIVKCNGFKPNEKEFTFKRGKNGVLERHTKLILKN